jgi:hypothetical protein
MSLSDGRNPSPVEVTVPDRSRAITTAGSPNSARLDDRGIGVRRGGATTGQTVGRSTYLQSSASDWTAMAMPAGADNMCPRHSLGPGRVICSERRIGRGPKLAPFSWRPTLCIVGLSHSV